MMCIIAKDQVPGIRVEEAIKKGVHTNILFVAGGGIGDAICAEPVIRYAVTNFRDCLFSLLTPHPEIFTHLYRFFKDVNTKFDLDKYLVLRTYVDEADFNNNFFTSFTMNAVDFASVCAIRSQLPVCAREVVQIPPKPVNKDLIEIARHKRSTLIHTDGTWASKRFPVEWWDILISMLLRRGVLPVLIGSKTLPLETTGCVDLRGRTSILEIIWMLQNSKLLLTNDSFPIHAAASSNFSEENKTWIGTICTVKKYDYCHHFRGGRWGHHMKDFALGGIWSETDICPNKGEAIEMKQKFKDSWLQSPDIIANWARSKV